MFSTSPSIRAWAAQNDFRNFPEWCYFLSAMPLPEVFIGSVADSPPAASSVRPAKPPTGAFLYHYGVYVTLRSELGVDVIAIGSKLLRNVEHESTWLRIHSVWHVLLVDAGIFNCIAQ